MAWILVAVIAVAWILLSAIQGNAMVSPTESKVQQFAEAIAFAEGFWDRNRKVNAASRPARNNNPGDIIGAGDTGQRDGVYAVFSSLTAGWSRLYKQVNLDLSGASDFYQAPGNRPFTEFTISDYAYAYTATEQDAWSENVASWLGVTRDTKIVDWLGA